MAGYAGYSASFSQEGTLATGLDQGQTLGDAIQNKKDRKEEDYLKVAIALLRSQSQSGPP